MTQLAEGLRARERPDLAADVTEEPERLRWFLWHGNVFCALQVADDLAVALDRDDAGPAPRELLRAVQEFGGYVRANAAAIPDDGDRYRPSEPIASAFVESAVDQVVSKRLVKQQLRWTPRGAHLLVQVRPRVLNDELAGAFRRWYPAFTHPGDQGTGAA